MIHHLSLVYGEARAMPEFAAPPVSLNDRTQRPGELADVVAITLDDVGDRASSLAERARLPLPLYVTIAVEARRTIDEVAIASRVEAETLADYLDDAATHADVPHFEPPASRPLRAYARALRSGGYKSRPNAAVELIVSDRLRARWSLAAQGAGLAIEAWVIAQLARSRPGVERWEAQAAAEARSMAEWVALQALLRCRRSSASAQASADG